MSWGNRYVLAWDEADEAGDARPSIELVFDTAWSANGLAPSVATVIAERMGTFLGSTCEPS
ncbi:MAG: hypothetical protein KIT31_22065 [Deltaproteobacteria bacterium]|nr:hypothetical protein [Deltaproteobacteria bacterium]